MNEARDKLKTGAVSTASGGWDAPIRGDKYYWASGGIATVVRVDGSMTVVQTSAGSMVNVPTGTLCIMPKAQPNDELKQGSGNATPKTP